MRGLLGCIADRSRNLENFAIPRPMIFLPGAKISVDGARLGLNVIFEQSIHIEIRIAEGLWLLSTPFVDLSL